MTGISLRKVIKQLLNILYVPHNTEEITHAS